MTRFKSLDSNLEALANNVLKSPKENKRGHTKTPKPRLN